MLKAEQVPDEVVEAAAQAAWKLKDQRLLEILKATQPDWKDEARATIAAIINAWPEVKRVKGYFTHDTDYYEPAIILPLNTETDNAEV